MPSAQTVDKRWRSHRLNSDDYRVLFLCEYNGMGLKLNNLFLLFEVKSWSYASAPPTRLYGVVYIYARNAFTCTVNCVYTFIFTLLVRCTECENCVGGKIEKNEMG